MEEIASNMQVAGMKLENLGKAYEQLQSQASSFLLFSLQWKDLQGHFDSLSKSIGDRLESLNVRAKEVELKENRFGVTEEGLVECSRLLREKEEQLRLVLKSFEECCEAVDLNGKKLEEVKRLNQETSNDIGVKENHLASLKDLIQEHVEELEKKEKEWKVFQIAVAETSAQLELKEKDLAVLRKSIDECQTRLKPKENRLHSIEKDIEDRSKELENKEKQLSHVQQQLRLCRQDFELKEREYGAIMKSIEEGNKELNAEGQRLKSIRKLICERQMQLRSKEEECNRDHKMITNLVIERDEVLKSIQRNIGECNRDLGKKEEQLILIQNLIIEREREIKSKDTELKEILKNFKIDYEKREGELKSIQKKITQRDEELKTKEKALDSIKNSISGLAKDLESKSKSFDDLVSKEEELKSLQRRINEQIGDLESNRRDLDLLKLQMEERSMELEMNEKQFEERMKNLESKEKQFQFREQVKKLELKEKLFEGRMKKLELKEKQFESLRKSFEEEKVLIQKSKILLPEVKTEQLDFVDTKSVKNGKDVQVLFNELLKKHEFVCHEVSNALRASLDPAKLVLDGMQGFYPPNLSQGDNKYDANIIRRSCIHLLDELKKISPVISYHVKEESMKLACEWREKMSVANKDCLEVLGFLKFVATYDIGSSFNANELQMLLDIVSQHCQTSELRQALGIETVPDNQHSAITDGINLQLLSSKQKDAPELIDNDIVVDLQPSDPAKPVIATTDGINLQLLSNQQTNAPQLMANDNLVGLQSSDPAKVVLDDIWKRIVPQSQKGEKRAIMERSDILLLEWLMSISPDIKPCVREEAMKLALVLKAEMRENTENSSEVLGFLLLLSIYGLVSSFKEDEILKLFEISAQHEKTVELFRTLGFADKISDFVQNLIKKQQPIEAVRFICAYQLAHKFAPVDLLRAYVQNAKMVSKRLCKKKPFEVKDKARDEEAACLQTALKCISDNNLETPNLVKEIENRIGELERLKANRVRTTTAGPASRVKVQQEQEQKPASGVKAQQEQEEQQKQKKRSNGAVIKKHQERPCGSNNKRPRTTAVTPSVAPVFIPTHQPMVWHHQERVNLANGMPAEFGFPTNHFGLDYFCNSVRRHF